jgi:hypothetical protein
MELGYDAFTADLLALWGSEDEFQPLSSGERLAGQVGGEVVERSLPLGLEDRPNEFASAVETFITK